ncbi:MAG: SDR family NAD(P)-dependent oxidoreductase [Bacteroidales bacterium]|nr:SDR family NAD(P)-dependent oxidoreductase [Bacteroidales bacterium]
MYLITGGAGGLGLIMAHEIATSTKGATVVLTGRSALSDQKKATLKSLESLGAKVSYQTVDVTDKKAVSILVREIVHEFGNLNGIIHSAGTIQDNLILNKTLEEFQSVLMPKVAGTGNLDEATKNLAQLDFFVLFSSGAGVMGNIGQADYSAANAFMDAFAHNRNLLLGKERWGRTLSINWPLWKAGGMGVNEATEQMLKQGMGMVAMETGAGIEAFYKALSLEQPQVVVMAGLLQRMKQKFSLSAAKKAVPAEESSTQPKKCFTCRNKQIAQ